MSEQEIIEGNKLIAKFLYGHLYEDDGIDSWIEKNGEVLFYLEDAKYHSSWDWLMPVVEKIMQISNNTFWRYSDIVIKKDSCELWIGQHIKSPVIGLHVIVSSDWNGYKNDNYLHIFKKYNGNMYCIDYCYIAIIEFIKWYNTCQKN